ncbi:hypothetical protein MMC32_003990 [Xylographa parallela]|nr:hypothetical protein [Xylographa parallela]
MHRKVGIDPTMNTGTEIHVAHMSASSPGASYRPEPLECDHTALVLRQRQNALVQPFQRLLERPVVFGTRPAESQSWFAQSIPRASSTRNELLTAGSSSGKVVNGYQPTAMSVDDVFASEIAAQRRTLADRQAIVDAEKWKRLREQRVARKESLAVQKAERTKRIAEEEAGRKRLVTEQEIERMTRIAEQDVDMEVQRLAQERAKMERQVLVEHGPKVREQHHRKQHNFGGQRVQMDLQREAERHRNMRAQEKLLEQVYKEHNIDVIKLETSSGGAMYAPWDSILGDILDEQKQEELDRKGIYFWFEAGTAISVPQDQESLETMEDTIMSG